MEVEAERNHLVNDGVIFTIISAHLPNLNLEPFISSELSYVVSWLQSGTFVLSDHKMKPVDLILPHLNIWIIWNVPYLSSSPAQLL